MTSDGVDESTVPAVLYSANVYGAAGDSWAGGSLATIEGDEQFDLPVAQSSGASPTNTGWLYDVPLKEYNDNATTCPPPTPPVFRISESAAAYRKMRALSSDPDATDYPLQMYAFTAASPRSIYIHSPYLGRRIGAFAGYWPPNPLSYFLKDVGTRIAVSIGTVRIAEPWSILFQIYSKLEDFVLRGAAEGGLPDSGEDLEGAKKLELEHCRLLYDFLTPHYASRVQPWLSSLQSSAPQLPFFMISYILVPGTDVYITDELCVRAAVVTDLQSNNEKTREDHPYKEITEWIVNLWYLDSDGYRIGRVTTQWSIATYEGTILVTDLDICPCAI